MSNFSRSITSLNSKLVFVVVTLAVISVAVLVVHNNKTGASAIAQDRFYQVKEKELLREVIQIEDINNIHSPEFPKGLQVKIKNVSSKPIYHITVLILLPETRPFLTGGQLAFNMVYGNPKLVSSKLQLSDLEESDRKGAPLKPGESCLLEIGDTEAELLRKKLERAFGSDARFTNNIVVSVQVINFGDGTGYVIGRPYSSKKNISLEAPKKPGVSGLDLSKGLTSKFMPPSSLFSSKPSIPPSCSCGLYLLQPPVNCVNTQNCPVSIAESDATGLCGEAEQFQKECAGSGGGTIICYSWYIRECICTPPSGPPSSGCYSPNTCRAIAL